ncbi:protein TIME FOR COFFEE-like isoform X2 [Phoenix dactylifera]|uniref:Protein TIME FOR COFFEE-like isoform X2 n=1 Tax=Phoenix dactylifera TaxID=42345 RepID=A0A8B7CMZ7_PHODC|nr:protein TIME FOR COFFEE-like isoform X2 [Phoenix dactylifera]
MERNREPRRGTVAAVNGGLSRRRQRSSSLRDSPEEDGGIEMAETTRLRDRGSKKDRDRDRSSRSKRRRGERMLHGSNRDEGDDSSEDSVDEEEEYEEEDVSVAVRLPPPPPPPPNPASSSSVPQNNHYHNHQQQNRKSFPTKVTTRSPPVWKPDEMIGFSVPRKARSASAKRSHEYWVSGGSGSGEQIPRQASASPSRLSPASTTQISPSSSNASARKKMKPMSGPKHRPPKVSKSPSLIQEDIEIEVAEVLFGMTRQFQCPPRQETSKIDSKDTNGGSGNEAKSRVSSPNSISPAPPASQPSVLPPTNSSSNPNSLPTAAPKRKKPRPVKFEEEIPSSPGGPLAPVTSKMESEHQMKAGASSPRSEKGTASPITENGGGSIDVSVPSAAAAPLDVQQESAKIESNPVPDSKLLKGEPDGQNRMENQKEPTPPVKETPCADLDVHRREETTAKTAPAMDSRREERFCIDLMAPPPGKLSPEGDSLCEFNADRRSQGPQIEVAPKVDIERKEEKVVEKIAKGDEMVLEDRKVDKSTQEEFDLKKQMVKEKTFDLQIDLEKPDKDVLSSSKLQLQKQQQRSPKVEPKHEKPAPSAPPPAMPMTIAGWPGSLPPFGYMGQVPSLQAVVPMDGASGASNSLQPPSFLSPQPRPKRCATHCYIAQNIDYHQKISRMNPFWPAAAGGAPLYGAKTYNLSVVPPSDGRTKASFQDNKGAPPIVAAFTGPPSQERMPAANNATTEAAQKKQLVLHQMPQSGSAATNMLHGPTFIFPLNQQQAAAAAAAAAATATRSGASKSAPGTGKEGASSGASTSAVASNGTGGGSAAAMNLSFTGLPPNEAQYLAILQNNAYPFPIPTHVGGPPSFRGASTAQAMPFFNGPFYASQMLHPSQLQQQQQLLGPQPAPHTQQGQHQHTSTSSGSSSSQKHPQPLQAPGGGASGAGGSTNGFQAMNQRQHLLPHQARQKEGNKPLEESPSTTDGRNFQAQKNAYAHNFAVPIYPQNFVLMPTTATAAALGSGGGHSDKQLMLQQQPQQNHGMKVEFATSQAFAMPFASFGGVAAAPSGLDFSSMAQNQAIFQALPDPARHGYNQIAAAAAAAAAQEAQQKKTRPEDGKPAGGESMGTNAVGQEERRMITGSKGPSSGLQHSFSFSKPDSGPPFSSMLGNNVIDSSSRTLGLIPAPANRSSSGAASTTTSAAAVPIVNIPNSQQQQQQQQQQFLQLQKQQQQQQQQLASSRTKSSGSSNNASERAGSSVTKFPQALAGFPQSLMQGGSSSHSPQWKASTTRAATPAPTQSCVPTVVKNNPPLQQQGRAPQQSCPAQSHQTQISFGVNSMKAVPAGGTSNPSSSSASAITVGSPPNSVSKSANGSPQASASAKPGLSSAVLPLPHQSSVRSSASSSGHKSSRANNRHAPSILGHPHIDPAPNSSTKPQQQQAQQVQKQQQPFSQAQFFFSNVCMQAQSPQSNAGAAAAAGYYQRRPSEQPPSQQAQQQSNSAPGSSGMLALGPTAATLGGASTMTDPVKAVAAAAAAAAAAANGMKVMPPPGLLHAAHRAVAAQSASGAPHPLMPASFPYMTVPAGPLKPASDQKPAAA